MTSRRTPKVAVGALGSYCNCFLHSSTIVHKKISNKYLNNRLENPKIVGRKEKVVSRKKKLCYLEIFPNQALHIVIRMLKIVATTEDEATFGRNMQEFK